MEHQEYAEAARLFEQLASVAEQRGIPRAPQLFMRAGHALLHDGQIDRGMSQIMHALTTIEHQARWPQWTALSKETMKTLQALNLDDESATLVAYIQKTEGKRGPLPNLPTTERPKAQLPGKCPHCGGNVLPNQVEWINETQAACDYCGSLIQGEA